MPRGKHHSEALRAAALSIWLEHQTPLPEISKQLGVPYHTVRRWIRLGNPAKLPETRAVYERNAEKLGNLVYDVIVETLESIRARAIATRSPDWVERQDAASLAALDSAQWDRVIRVIASFRPIDRSGEGEEPTIIDQPEADRNGAVDPAV